MVAQLRAGVAYVMAAGLCLFILALLFELPSFDLSIPLVYGDDALFTHALAKTLIEQPWCLTNPALGAPGAMEMYDFPMADGLHFLGLKACSLVRSDWAGVVNLYFLATFPLTTLTSLYAMRRLGLTFPTAAVGSLLFAFLPYHLIRSEGHLLLSGYYVTPLSVLAAVWIYLGDIPARRDETQGPKSPWRRRFALAALCLLQASAGVYYAAFAGFSLLVAGIAGSVQRRAFRPVATAVVLIAATAAGVLVNVSPTLVHWSQHGQSSEPIERTALQAEVLGLKIVQLLLPVRGHRWKVLANLRERYYQDSLPANENDSVLLGSVAAFGFIGLLLRSLFFRRRGASDLLDALSTLNLAAVLLATTSGFGMIFSLVVDPHIRAYNRIGVFLAFFALTAVARLMEPWVAGWGKGPRMQCLGCCLVALILVLGVLDQAPPLLVPTPPWVAPDQKVVAEQFHSDAEFVARVEAVAPRGALIFQMPYMFFPESPYVHRASSYDHLRPYLHSKHLRWSFGSMRGRPTDLWRRSLESLSLPQRLAAIEQAGFRGILVNRRGFEDGGCALEEELARLTEATPLVSRDQDLAYFPLRRVYRPSAIASNRRQP